MRFGINKLVQKVKNATRSQIKNLTKKSLDFARDTARKAFRDPIKRYKTRKIIKGMRGSSKEAQSSVSLHSGIPLIGNIYQFSYPDPLYKTTLPYWDALPIVIPIGYDGTRKFLGLNMHYLPPILRAELFDMLLKFKAETIDTGLPGAQREYLNISYDVLKSLPKTIYKPTIHWYLYKRIKSQFAHIPLEFAEELLFLPTEQFKSYDIKSGSTNNVSKRVVWTDSKGAVQ